MCEVARAIERGESFQGKLKNAITLTSLILEALAGLNVGERTALVYVGVRILCFPCLATSGVV